MTTVSVATEDKPPAHEPNKRLVTALQDACWSSRPKLKNALEFLRDHGRITPDDKRELNFWSPQVRALNDILRDRNFGIHLVISQQGQIVTCENI
jgi:hypothetical protein